MKNRFATLHLIIEELNNVPNVEFVEWVGDFAYQVTPVLVRCTVHGTEWETTPLKLCVQKFKCVDCSRRKSVTEEDIINLVNKEGNKFRFVSWEGGFKGSKSILNVICKDCGEPKVSTYENARYTNSCASCRELERIEKIENEVRSFEEFEFIQWLSDVKTMISPVLMRCKEHGVEWKTTVDNLKPRGMGCPVCAKERNYGGRRSFGLKQKVEEKQAVIRQGYSALRKGYLYFLVSANKRFAKVGISNVPENRLSQLRRDTPFDFECVGMFEHENGAIARMLETSIHKKYSADNCGFTGGSWGGCTEWFFLTPELEAEMRSLIAP